MTADMVLLKIQGTKYGFPAVVFQSVPDASGTKVTRKSHTEISP